MIRVAAMSSTRPPFDPASAVSVIPLRVRFCDTDLMGIVHHARYLEYFEAARVEWLRRRGVAYKTWASKAAHLPVVEATLRYRLPARFDDLLAIETRLTELRSASLRFEFRIDRDGDALTEGSVRLACIDDVGALRRFSDEMLLALTSPESLGP